MKTLFKVINQSDPIQITKQDGSLTNKCSIVLQEIGGKYENTYVASLYGQPTPNREQSSSLELPRCEGRIRQSNLWASCNRHPMG